MGNSASSLPYSIGKTQVAVVNNGWILHEGQRKSDGSAVSVFVAKKPVLHKTPVSHAEPNSTQYNVAQQHFINCKKLRHPHILQVHATLDTDNPNDLAATAVSSSSGSVDAKSSSGDWIIVTEPVIPLQQWLSSSPHPHPEQVAWGLECMVRALSFLHGANLVHGNVAPESFFVTRAGDVKLWNFGITCSLQPVISNHFKEYERLVTPQAYRSPERIQQRWDALSAAGIHVMDAYSLGVLIAQVMFSPNNLPPTLVKAVQRLQSPNIQRPRLQPLLQCPIFNTPYQKWQLQLEEFPIQSVPQKIAFFQNVTSNLQAGVLPSQVGLYKLLPLIESEISTICGNETLRGQDEYRKQVLASLTPMFYIAENYNNVDFAKLGTTIGILFKVNDRAIRGHLLQKATFLADKFDANVLNEAVFEPLCSGFSDSSAALRDLTLKATASLMEFLTPPNLEKLCRYLVRLQSDPETSLRVNTVIFFRKLAPYLSETTRQKMLLPALTRALKDPFAPCRLSSLQSMRLVKEYFSMTDIAVKVLPAVTPQLLDSTAAVRKEAFSVVDDFLFILKQESERMKSLPEPVVEQQQQQVMPPPTTRSSKQQPVKKPEPAPKSGGSGWGTVGLSSWMTSKATPDETAPRSAPVAVAQQQQRAVTIPQPSIPQQQQPMSGAMNSSLNDLSVNDDDNWGDNDDDAGGWDDDLDLGGGGPEVPSSRPVIPVRAAVPPPAASSNLFAATDNDDDDFFGGFDSKPAKPVAMQKPKGKLVVPLKKTTPKPAVKKLSVDDDKDGWDDF